LLFAAVHFPQSTIVTVWRRTKQSQFEPRIGKVFVGERISAVNPSQSTLAFSSRAVNGGASGGEWMGCRKLVGFLVLVAFLMYAVARPAPARADFDSTDIVIISSAVAGGVALILIIAIVMADRNKEDPDFLDALVPVQPGSEVVKSERTIRFGPQCLNAGGGPALLCW
jgi:hypothetical protein